MSARLLLDTNVLIYPHDPSEPVKQRAAARILSLIQASGTGSISTQVLSEYYSVMTTKLRPRVAPEEALASLERQAVLWQVLQVTTATIIEAAHAARKYGIHFRDAQLWAVARMNGIGCILTEDLRHGATLGGVHIINPFHPAARLDELLA
jgi:predicted nucleic acid-binding protein